MTTSLWHPIARRAAQALALCAGPLAVLGGCLLASMLTVLPLPAHAQQRPPANAPAQVPPPPAVGGAADTGNSVEAMARRSGMNRCLDAARRFGPSLAGAPSEHSLLWWSHPQAPDAASASMSVERQVPGGGVQFISATFAPTTRGGCDLNYEMVNVWAKSCQDVAAELQGGSTANPLVIARAVTVVPRGPFHHIYLIRTPGGCVSISKELLFS